MLACDGGGGVSAGAAPSVSGGGRPELAGTFGMVASTHWLASAAGMAMLERGGNAADAAVAAGLLLQVVEPHLNGPGGEVPILVHTAGAREPVVINGQGCVPAGASVTAYRALGLELVPGTGLLAACVPGAFGAWMRLLAEHGSMSPRDVMTPAIGYAAHGHPILVTACAAIGRVQAMFTSEWPESARIWLGGGVPVAGDLVRNPALAATWERLLTSAEAAGSGREAQIEAMLRDFYEGWVAEAVVGFAQGTEVMDSSGRRHCGLLSAADMAAGRAVVERPASWSGDGVTVWKTGSWGQGPVMLQQLALLEGFDLVRMGMNSAEYIHTVVECAKLAFADREAWYGDAPGGAAVDELLDPSYTAERRALVGNRASMALRPGSVGGREPRLPAGVSWQGGPAVGIGEPSVAPDGVTRGDTVHLDVIDRYGTMISATPSGGWLQSSPAIPGLGFCLGTRAQMTWLEEGLASSLVGGRRPRTTLSPSLATREGAPLMAWGSPGGDQQDQWPLLVWLAHTRWRLGLQDAIDAPRFHIEHMPSSFYPRESHPGLVVVEERAGEDVIDELRARGHEVLRAPRWSLGRVTAVARRQDGVLLGGADPRGLQSYAVGR
jgi:gamma-glutamyltranspeptidase / glutathione hydrolase